MQYEQVGVRISAAPYVMMPPSDAAVLLATLATLPGSQRDGDGVSILLGE
jgi:hypothetical protein